MTYYNTTHETENLPKFAAKAKSQDEEIKALIKLISEKTRPITPEIIYNMIFGNSPLTSIRRSFNTLEKEGFIEKTGQKVTGLYGRPVNVYKLVKA